VSSVHEETPSGILDEREFGQRSRNAVSQPNEQALSQEELELMQKLQRDDEQRRGRQHSVPSNDEEEEMISEEIAYEDDEFGEEESDFASNPSSSGDFSKLPPPQTNNFAEGTDSSEDS